MDVEQVVVTMIVEIDDKVLAPCLGRRQYRSVEHGCGLGETALWRGDLDRFSGEGGTDGVGKTMDDVAFGHRRLSSRGR